jgi:hypothetical protein
MRASRSGCFSVHRYLWKPYFDVSWWCFFFMISTTNILEMDGSCSFGVYLTWLSHVGNGRSRRSKHVSGGSSFKALMREAGTRSIWHQDMLRLLRFNMIQHPMNYIILNHTTFFSSCFFASLVVKVSVRPLFQPRNLNHGQIGGKQKALNASAVLLAQPGYMSRFSKDYCDPTWCTVN